MKIYAVTGRSGCGKSSVSAYLRQKGYTVADADMIAREIMLPPSPCPALLAQRFGSDILDEEGNLRRRLLADRAFATPEGTKALTDLTFPEIQRRIFAAADAARSAGEKLFFVDGAVIVGTTLQEKMDGIILVEVPTEVSVRRICARDGIAPEMARRRLDAQTSPEVLEGAADFILRNDCPLESLYSQIDTLLKEIGGL